ncbi:tetratricopeptide repeat protein [bacterium]|nr:tetratricopeptide repeat protein [bacterium]MCG2677700.1 tetratricopeptide repeat protein [bacterium]
MNQKRLLVILLVLVFSLSSSLLHADVEDGIAYMKEGKYKEAIEEFKDAAEEIEDEYDIPEDEEARESLVTVYHWLATAYTKNNMPQKAKETYQKILEISSLDVKAREELDRNKLGKKKREKEIESKFLEKESTHFTLKFEGTEEREYEAPEILAILEEAYKKVGADLGYYPQEKTVCIIYPSKEKFRYVTDTHYWTGGLYDGKIRVPLSIELDEAEHFKRTLVHEYTHHVIHGKTKDNCPSWLNEGLAQYEDRDYEEVREKEEKRMEVLTQSLEENTLVPLKRITPLFQTGDTELVNLAYYQSYSVVKYLIKRYGLKGVNRLLEKLGEGTSIDKALEEVFRIDYQALDKEWHKFLAQGEPFVARQAASPVRREATDKGEAMTLYSLAQNYEMNKMYDLAIREYQKIVKNHPNSIWAQKAGERIRTISTKKR